VLPASWLADLLDMFHHLLHGYMIFPYHQSNIYTMKVHVTWEHSSFKNVDLVAIKSFDHQAQIFNLLIFGKYDIFL
jgi:hypothetical protein